MKNRLSYPITMKVMQGLSIVSIVIQEFGSQEKKTLLSPKQTPLSSVVDELGKMMFAYFKVPYSNREHSIKSFVIRLIGKGKTTLDLVSTIHGPISLSSDIHFSEKDYVDMMEKIKDLSASYSKETSMIDPSRHTKAIGDIVNANMHNVQKPKVLVSCKFNHTKHCSTYQRGNGKIRLFSENTLEEFHEVFKECAKVFGYDYVSDRKFILPTREFKIFGYENHITITGIDGTGNVVFKKTINGPEETEKVSVYKLFLKLYFRVIEPRLLPLEVSSK